MDKKLYEAAITGNVNFLNQNFENIENQSTPDHNTVLHLASLAGHATAVNAVLNNHANSLIRCVNSRGETALHLASRGGHTRIVELLIIYASQSFLWIVNEEGNTALHEAVKYHHTAAAAALIDEDMSCSQSRNNNGETALYLAASRGYVDLVDVILSKCGDGTAYGGPYSTTALHGAVICRDSKASEDCIDKILNTPGLTNLVRQRDVYGQTPLHYATHTGCTLKVTKLLDSDESTLYLSDNDNNAPLHIAASRGYTSIMHIIMSRRPDSCHMVDKKGRNILHIAVKKEKKKTIEFILKHCLILKSLIVQKDIDGNTPLHLIAMSSNFYVKKLVEHSMADMESLNNEMFTPFDMVKYTKYDGGDDWPKLRIEEGLRRARPTSGYPNVKKMRAVIKGITTIDEDDHIDMEEIVPFDPRKIIDNHIIVATLIATVTFAAGFTLPGGYIQSGSMNEGMAILTKHKAFKFFMVFDTVALICSIIAIVIYSVATDYMTRRKIKSLSRRGGWFAIIALTSMLLAFLFGIYAVLSHSPIIATVTAVIGCIAFPTYICVLLSYGWDYLTHDM